MALNPTDTIEIGGLALSVAVIAIQALHFVLSLQNQKSISDLKAQIALQMGGLQVYMHEKFVTKDELQSLLENIERERS